MTPRAPRSLLWFLSSVFVAGLAMLNYFALTEAFGSGPPYYGRTTNMDKWSNPVPMLLLVDVGAIAILWLLSRLARRT